MDSNEQTAAFESDLRKLIARYRSEFEMNLASVIGTLEVVKLNLWKEQMDMLDEDD